MGIRVHKCVGYGMRGFEPTSKFLEIMDNSITHEEFGEWIEKNRLPILELMRKTFPLKRGGQAFSLTNSQAKLNRPERLNCVHYDEEFGISDALLIYPYDYPHWSRHDDTIDWLEESSQQNRFEHLNQGIFPFQHGDLPVSLAALTLYYEIPEVFPKLREAIYVYWG